MFAFLLVNRPRGGFFVFDWRMMWMRFLLAAIIVLMMMPLAYAASTTPVDFTPLWATLTPYFIAGLVAVLAWVRLKMNAWLATHRWTVAQDDLDQALAHVPTLVTAELRSLASHNSTVEVPNVISKVATLVAQMAPAAVTQLKISPAQFESLVAAKLPTNIAATNIGMAVNK